MTTKFYCIWATPCKDKAEATKNFCNCEGRGKRPREDYDAIERAIHRSQAKRKGKA